MAACDPNACLACNCQSLPFLLPAALSGTRATGTTGALALLAALVEVHQAGQGELSSDKAGRPWQEGQHLRGQEMFATA